MIMNNEISKEFLKIIINTLSTDQVRYLGERNDSAFDLNKILNISHRIPVPRQTAAEVLLNYFNTDEKIIQLFNYLLEHDGKRFNSSVLNIWKKDDFIGLLTKNKWIYDSDIRMFLRDPFYEHEMNLLNRIRILDLRHEFPFDDIIKEVAAASKNLKMRDLEWRITSTLYDIDPKSGELIRKILGLLLAKQNLQLLTPELYTCLKELAINASKANYKQLFEKHITRKEGISTKNNYHGFLIMFKEEINNHGNKRLIELAREEDQFINIIFQSTNEAIEIWVTNNSTISSVEKKQMIKKLKGKIFEDHSFEDMEDDLTEGAGFGLNLIISILRKYTADTEPVKVVFYPNFIKVGFSLLRSDMAEKMKQMFSEE